jgi:hypothetical protein
MRAAILGDSFVQYFSNTWIETVSKDFDWEVILHKGFPGACQHRIYELFIDTLKSRDLDIVLFSHTEPHRLANRYKEGINYITVTQDVGKQIPQDLRQAACQYYDHIYYDRFHVDTHNLMIADIQRICVERNIKQIHMQSFNNIVPMTSGLWLVNGLHELAMLSGNEYYKDYTLKNHFSPQLHDKFGKWLSNHIRYYLDNKLDYNVVQLYKDEFR